MHETLVWISGVCSGLRFFRLWKLYRPFIQKVHFDRFPKNKPPTPILFCVSFVYIAKYMLVYTQMRAPWREGEEESSLQNSNIKNVIDLRIRELDSSQAKRTIFKFTVISIDLSHGVQYRTSWMMIHAKCQTTHSWFDVQQSTTTTICDNKKKQPFMENIVLECMYSLWQFPKS